MLLVESHGILWTISQTRLTLNADASVPLNNEYLTVAGCGVIVEGVSSTQSDVLREVDVQYMTNDECDGNAGLYSGEYVTYEGYIEENM